LERRKRELSEDELQTFQSITSISDEEAFEIFTRQKRIEGVGATTVKHYGEIMNVIRRDLLRIKIDKQIVDLTTANIENLILYWKDNVRVATVNNRIRVMKPYYKVLDSKNAILQNPMKDIHQQRERIEIKETLTDKDIEKIANHFKKRKTFVGFRDLIIFYLLIDTGIRIGECMNILVKDVGKDSIVIVMTKNMQERFVYPSPKCLKAIRSFMKVRGNIENVPQLFVTVDNTQLNKRTYQEALREAGRICNIQKNVSPHMLRRTYAKNAIMNGIDAFSLARLLGHQSLEVTSRYVQMYGTDLQKQSKHRADYGKYF
jgi:site-specific recombinase XerD